MSARILLTSLALASFSWAFAQTQPDWSYDGMAGEDGFVVVSPQGRGQRLNVQVACSDLTGSQLIVTVQGVGFTQPADFLPGTVRYYSDAGGGEESAKVFLTATSTKFFFDPRSSSRIIQRMLNSR